MEDKYLNYEGLVTLRDVLKVKIDDKQNKLKAGSNITITDDNTISATGGDAGRELTQAEYDAGIADGSITDHDNITYYIKDGQGSGGLGATMAQFIGFNNAKKGRLSSDNVQDAIDEIDDKITGFTAASMLYDNNSTVFSRIQHLLNITSYTQPRYANITDYITNTPTPYSMKYFIEDTNSLAGYNGPRLLYVTLTVSRFNGAVCNLEFIGYNQLNNKAARNCCAYINGGIYWIDYELEIE